MATKHPRGGSSAPFLRHRDHILADIHRDMRRSDVQNATVSSLVVALESSSGEKWVLSLGHVLEAIEMGLTRDDHDPEFCWSQARSARIEVRK